MLSLETFSVIFLVSSTNNKWIAEENISSNFVFSFFVLVFMFCNHTEHKFMAKKNTLNWLYACFSQSTKLNTEPENNWDKKLKLQQLTTTNDTRTKRKIALQTFREWIWWRHLIENNVIFIRFNFREWNSRAFIVYVFQRQTQNKKKQTENLFSSFLLLCVANACLYCLWWSQVRLMNSIVVFSSFVTKFAYAS